MSDYIDPRSATRIRLFTEEGDPDYPFTIDGADAGGGYTEQVWKAATRTDALALAATAVRAELGDLPIYESHDGGETWVVVP